MLMLSELLYADDSVLISETIDRIVDKRRASVLRKMVCVDD